MNKIFQYVPKSVVDWTNYTKNTLAPLALQNIISLGVEVGLISWLFEANRKDIAVAAILRRGFETFGNQGISYLERNYKLKPTHQSVLKVANAGLSFFASYFVARSAGYEIPIGLCYNSSISVATQLLLISQGNPLENFLSPSDPYENSEKIEQITKNNFQEKVQSSSLPTIVNAYAIWYPYSKKVAPIFTEAAKELEGKVNFAKINIDQEKELVKTLNIQDIPAFLFFKDGKVVHNHTGMTNKKHFSSLIKQLDFC
jgi:thioredoxin 1